MHRILIYIFTLVVIVSGSWWYVAQNRSEQKNLTPSSSQQTAQPAEQVPPQFDKTKYSQTMPGSIWVVVNKKSALPASYKPSDLMVPDVPLRLASNQEQMQLRTEAGTALKELFASAKTAGFQLMLGSGFRSYGLQKSFYDGYVSRDGVVAADRYSARPGHSEHQTGLGVDIDRSDQKCHLEECFGELAEGKWLAEHAWEYGFILRYLPGKEAVTGYKYEPWHFRYVGKELAEEMRQQNVTTLEEFFGLASAPNY